MTSFRLSRYLFLVLSAVLLLPASAQEQEKKAGPEGPYFGLFQFLTAVEILRHQYVDPEQVSYEKLFHAAISGMLKSLDPYTSLELKSGFQQFERTTSTLDATKKENGIIGVVAGQRNRKLEIISVVRKGPADLAGIRAGDEILSLDGTPVGGLSFDKAVSMIRGYPGSTVKLKLHRKSENKTFEVSVKRVVRSISSVTGLNIPDKENHIGYLRITEFDHITAKELQQAILDLQKDGMQSLVIDLRNNPGGLLEAAAESCSLFLPEGQVIVTIEGREQKKTVKAVKAQQFLELPIAILVNRNSASAAEIFAGTMQDLHRAVLVGEKTFGKGSVQTLFPFGEKETLKITTAKYYTPRHRVIHGVGIRPDIDVRLSDSDSSVIAGQMSVHPGEIRPTVISAIPDVQLRRAVEILKGAQILKSNSTKHKETKQ